MVRTDIKNKWGRLIFPLLSLYFLYGCVQDQEERFSFQVEKENRWYKNASDYVTDKEYNKALELLDSTGINAIDPGNHLLKGKAYHLKGYVYKKQGKETEALTNYYYALDELKKVSETEALSRLLNDIGSVYEKNNYLEKALENYREAYDILEGNPTLAMRVLNNISLTYKNMGAYGQALKYYHKGLDLANQLQDINQQALFMNNLCVAYRHQEDFEKSKYYGLKALEIRKQKGNEKKLTYVLNNLGLVYMETQQSNKAMEYLQQAILPASKYKLPELTIIYNNLAGLYLEKQDFRKAGYYLDKALALNSSRLENRSRTLELKSTIAEAQGKFLQSTGYQKQIVALKDSIHNKQDTINDLSYNNLLLVQERVERENAMHKERIDYQKQVNRWITIAVIVALVGITVITILYWRLRQATLIMDTYTKNMSHTMRNQFNAILGNAYIVKGLLRKMKVSPEEDTRPEAYEAISSISDILQSSAETTTNIITTRHVRKVQAESDLYKPVRAVSANVKTYTPAARKKDIILKEEIISDAMVTVHGETYENALGNLVSNAIKYSPENSTIILRLYEKEGQVFLTVLDEGPGIAEKDQKRLFKKGVKLHHMKNIVSSGVGLYYAKRDVEAMGGKMYHENRPEGGSAFTIEFPKSI